MEPVGLKIGGTVLRETEIAMRKSIARNLGTMGAIAVKVKAEKKEAPAMTGLAPTANSSMKVWCAIHLKIAAMARMRWTAKKVRFVEMPLQTATEPV
jgi:hypothetical protein